MAGRIQTTTKTTTASPKVGRINVAIDTSKTLLPTKQLGTGATMPSSLPSPKTSLPAPKAVTNFFAPKPLSPVRTRDIVRELPGALKDVFLPDRGFSKQQYQEAKPTVLQKAIALPKTVAEIGVGLGTAAANIPLPKKVDEAIAKSKKTTVGRIVVKAGEAIENFSIPKTPEEASAMRFADVITALPIGSVRVGKLGLEQIAKSTDANYISKVLMREVPNLTKDQADVLAKPLVHIYNIPDTERALNRIDLAVNKAKTAETRVTDPAQIQEIRNSIEEGQLTLRTGEFNGRVLNKEELLAVRRSVENDLKKIGESRLSNVPKYEVEDVTPADFGPSTPEAPVGRLQAQKTAEQVDKEIKELSDSPEFQEFYRGGKISGKSWNEYQRLGREYSQLVDEETVGPLLQEARKYKSAEEFVSSVKTGDEMSINTLGAKTGKPVVLKSYHGTNKDFTDFKITEKGVRYSGDGVYFTPSKSGAENFGKNVKEVYLDLKNPYVKYLPEGNIDQQFNELAKEVKNKGYDSMIIRLKDTDTLTKKLEADWINEIVVFDTNTIKTKSQLTDIWNKANNTKLKSEDFGAGQPSDIKGSKRFESTKSKGFDDYFSANRKLDNYVGPKPTPPVSNRSLNETNTAKVVADTISGKREDFRLTNEKQLTQAKTYKAITDKATPETSITVFRVAPKGSSIKAGDHIATTEKSLDKYLNNRSDSEVIKAEVKIKDLVKSDGLGDEFIYSPTRTIKEDKQVITQYPPKKELSAADKLIAQGKIRVVSREGKDVYQYRNKNDIWKNAPNEAIAVERTAGTKKLLLPKKTDIQNLPENLQEEDYLISLEEDALMDSPYSNPDNRFFVDNEGRVRELGDVKSPKLIRIMEDTMAQAGIKDPTEFAEGLEKYFKQKEKLEIRKKQFRLDKEKAKLTVSLGAQKDILPIAKSEGEVRTLEKIANQQLEKSIPEAESLSNIIQQTKTDVKKKVNILDYIRTPDRILQKIGFAEEGKLLRQQYEAYLKELPKNIDKITAWSKQVSKESNERIFKYLDGQAINLTDAEKTVALEIKAWLKEWATRLKLPESNQISDYITRLFDEEIFGKEFSDDLAKLITDRLPGSVYNPFLEKRLGAKGYKQDTWQALDAYVKRSTRKVHMDEALLKIQEKAGSTLEMSNIESSQFKYLQRYINNINLRPTELDNLIDNSVKSVIGYKLGQRPVTRVTRLLRQMTYRGMLGLNPGSALRNLSQGINTYATLGEKYTAIGYTRMFYPGALKELKDEGVLGEHFIQDRAYNATKKNIERFDKVLFSFFETAERINRGSAYFGAKSKALAEGKTEAEAVTYAKSIVRKTQFAFGSIDTPVALQNDILKTLFQFQTFTTKQIEFLTEMLKDKNFVGLLRYAVAGLAFVYTIGQAFGMEPREILPIYRVGVPPSLKFPWELGKAIVNAPDKYGNQPDLEKKVSNVGKAIIGLIPAGTQAKKTIEGLKAIQEGGSYDKGGNLQFTQGLSMAEKLQAILFGKYASNEAKEYFNKADVSKKEKAQIKPVYDQVQKLKEEDKMDEAQAIVDSLSEADWEVYKKYKTQVKKERTAELKKDVLPQYLKVQQLKDENNLDQAQEIVDSLTDEEWEVYQKIKKDFEKEGALKFDDGKTVVDETTLMESIVMVAKGLAVDPKVALQIILTKEKIRRIDNRTIIMERMTLEESQKIKTENNANNSDWKLDHIIPLQLGGDNSGDNLKLVPTATWEKYTDYENELGRKLRAGTITKKEAQRLITEFKNEN